MKKIYTEAELEVVYFETEDIIATSSQLGEDELPPVPVG